MIARVHFQWNTIQKSPQNIPFRSFKSMKSTKNATVTIS
jgi:hypothetical protein